MRLNQFHPLRKVSFRLQLSLQDSAAQAGPVEYSVTAAQNGDSLCMVIINTCHLAAELLSPDGCVRGLLWICVQMQLLLTVCLSVFILLLEYLGREVWGVHLLRLWHFSLPLPHECSIWVSFTGAEGDCMNHLHLVPIYWKLLFL